MIIAGIDPGANASCAIVDYEGRDAPIRYVDCYDVPSIGEGTKERIHVRALARWLKDEHKIDVVFVELVTPMPSIPGKDGERRGMGATSAFNFGGAVRSIEATVMLIGLPLRWVTPQSWKKMHGLTGLAKAGMNTAQVKEQSRLKAITLFPEADVDLKRKKDHGRAEAILIARAGAMLTRDE